MVWTVAVAGLGLVRAMHFVQLAAQAALTLHNKALQVVSNAPVNLFFDTTPVGQLLNRFSKDLDSVDMMVPEFMFTFFESVFFLLGIIIFCGVTFPAFLIVLLPLTFVFVHWRNLFAATTTQLKRIEGTTRSPLFTAFTELTSGLSHIRAFDMTAEFTGRFAAAVDTSSRVFFQLLTLTLTLTLVLVNEVFFHLQAMTPWMILRMDNIAAMLLFGVALGETKPYPNCLLS